MSNKICFNLYFRLGCIFIICGLIGIALPLFFSYKDTEERSCVTSFEYQVDCFPDIPREIQTKENCIKRNCCWNKVSYLNFPYCYHKLPTEEFYGITSESSNNSYYSAKLNMDNSSLWQELDINVKQWDENHLSIKISPKNKEEFSGYSFCQKNESTIKPIKVIHRQKNGRLFIMIRKGIRTFFDTRIGPMIFRKNYVEISSILPSYNIYGLGQSRKKRLGIDLQTISRWSLYSRHRNNDTRESNWPGVHPFYLCMEEGGKAHGVLIETSHPIEIVTTPGPLITFRILEDNLRLHFFFGPSPSEVISQLLECIGKPLFPPYWALGHHICYSNLTRVLDEVTSLRKERVEQESVCLTSITEDYSGQLTTLKSLLSSNQQNLILLQNPQIKYENYSEGEYFVKSSNLTVEPFIGVLDNVSVIYPDFLNQKATEKCREKNVDGFLLNFNTPLDTNWNSSKCKSGDNFAPDKIQLINISKDTICWNAVHDDGIQHYKVHNLYGHKHLETVWNCETTKNKKRPFIISESTFLGSGKFGGHWGGSNFATWEDLQQSIVDMLEYNMYGIPLIGAPYCGYRGDFDQDLCSRWLQLSALSPLMIGYRGEDEIPINLIKTSLISTVGKMVLRLRYSLLPYFYTLFYRAHANKHTVVRPLFFEFPNDPKTYHLNGQYMLGSALLVSPVINPDTERIIAYFPKGCWYSYYDGRVITSSGRYVSLSTIESHVNLHILGGQIVPSRSEGLTVKESQNKSFTLTIALKCADDDILAEGELFVDDGETDDLSFLICMKVQAHKKLNFTFITWPCKQNSLDENEIVSYNLEIIRFFGMNQEPKDLQKNHINIDSKNIQNYEYQFIVQDISLDLRMKNTISWHY